MDDSTPTVSAVIGAYNAAPFIGDAIASCLAQTVRPIEVLVIDDGSTDDTAAIAGRFGPPVRVVRQANRGEGGARNRGLDEAAGDWVAFLDADDLWEPAKLERQLAACKDSDIVGCHTNLRTFGSGGILDEYDYSKVPPDTRYTAVAIARDSPMMPSGLMVRNGLPLRFPEWANAAVDAIYNLQLAHRGRIVLAADPLMRYRRHERNMSSEIDFLIRSHRCMCRWLDDQNGVVSPVDAEAIRAIYLGRLLDAADMAKWRRKWNHHDAIRGYLVNLRGNATVDAFLARRNLPRWLYSLKDCCARFQGAVQ